MKKIKVITLSFIIGIIILIYFNYPKLNIISGYSAKYMNSSVFFANRSLEFTNKHDLKFTPVSLATNKVNLNLKSTTASSFGLLKREAIFREGQGSVLILDEKDKKKNYLKLKRLITENSFSFPYGNRDHKDTIFSNINYSKLNNAVSEIFADSSKTRAVLIVYKDKIISEKYANGFNKNSKILGWSMTKSITSTMFGILQHQGKINIFDQAPIVQWKNDERKNITINNLLQMNSGLEWNENYDKISDATKMLFLSRNMGNVQRDKKLKGKPNENWNYSSGTTNLLSNILRMQFDSHQEYLDFWYTDLIDKIGMNSMLIETDLDGNYVGSSYGWATTRDWAKLGLLYLHKGKWKNQQLFNQEWVKYATTPTNDSKGRYGAQIWLNKGGFHKGVPKSMYSFNGYQGQYIFIFPDQDLVIVRMGLSKKLNIDRFLTKIVSSIVKN